MSETPPEASPDTKPGVAAVRAMFDSRRAAADVLDIDPDTGDALAAEADPREIDDRGGDAGTVSVWPGGLPPDCPAQPLGRNKGQYFFINSDGQMMGLPASKFNANTLMDLFDGDTQFALRYWAGSRGALDAATCRDNMMAACRHLGVFNPENRVRGRGAWRGTDQELILHMGDEIWAERPQADSRAFHSEISSPGLRDGFVYEADEAMLRPWDDPVSGQDIKPILERLRSWEFVREKNGPLLMLGWIAMSYISGALEWRPHALVQGDSGCGKSSLQKMVGFMFGSGKVQVADASEAGLSSQLRNQTLPVMFDEFESSDDNRQVLAVINLMRRASSGAKRLRGSQDHSAHSSTNQSPFFVSMVRVPPLKTTDLNRMAFLQLRAFKPGTAPWKPDEKEWEVMGRKLFRRMLDVWQDYPDRFEAYSAALAAQGHNGRGQDTIGTLLACADMALGDTPPPSDLIADWVEGLAPSDMIEYEGVSSDFEQCLAYLLQSQPSRWQGDIHASSIGKVLANFVSHPDADSLDFAKKALEFAGLTLVRRRGPGPAMYDLFVPSNHEAVREIYSGSDWASKGAAVGGWSFALRMGPSDVWRNGTAYVSGQKSKGILVKLSAVSPRIERADEPREDTRTMDLEAADAGEAADAVETAHD